LQNGFYPNQDFILLQYHLEYLHRTSNIVWTDFVRWIIS